MSLPNQIIVSGAGTAAANGTYTKGADQNGYASWYKSGAQIYAVQVNASPLAFGWKITGDPYVAGGPGANEWYTGGYAVVAQFQQSPVGLTFNVASNGTAPAPSVTLPLSPVEERNAKYATEDETGEKRFRRLFGLGYV